MSQNPRDPSIENEPHLRGRPPVPDSSDANAERILGREKSSDDDRIEHTVWDEPALSRELAGGTPQDALTYFRWFDERRARTSLFRSWTTTVLIAIIAGPWAIIGAILGGSSSSTATGVAAVAIFGPVLEEVMKIAIPLWVVEKRPFLFCSRVQIAICAAAGGLVFAAVENLLYLHVYVPDPSELLVRWRWTICVVLHVGCSLVAGMGLMNIWSRVVKHRSKPEASVAAPYISLAIVIHGTYNGFAVLLEALKFQL